MLAFVAPRASSNISKKSQKTANHATNITGYGNQSPICFSKPTPAHAGYHLDSQTMHISVSQLAYVFREMWSQIWLLSVGSDISIYHVTDGLHCACPDCMSRLAAFTTLALCFGTLTHYTCGTDALRK